MPRTVTTVRHHQRELPFRTYASFEALAADGATMDALIECYQRVFGESEVWGEMYSHDDMVARLRDELAGEASLRICQDRSGNVLGFCWAQQLDAAQIVRAVESIQFYRLIALPDLRDRIDALLGGTRVLYVQELGIARSARGRIPLTQLINPVLADVAGRAGHGRVLFWTMPDTLISILARRGGCAEYPMPNGMRFHLSECRALHGDGAGAVSWIREEGGRPPPAALAETGAVGGCVRWAT